MAVSVQFPTTRSAGPAIRRHVRGIPPTSGKLGLLGLGTDLRMVARAGGTVTVLVVLFRLVLGAISLVRLLALA
jgi:hypothetical protein